MNLKQDPPGSLGPAKLSGSTRRSVDEKRRPPRKYMCIHKDYCLVCHDLGSILLEAHVLKEFHLLCELAIAAAKCPGPEDTPEHVSRYVYNLTLKLSYSYIIIYIYILSADILRVMGAHSIENRK